MLASRDKHCQTVMAACGISVARGGTDDLSAPCTGESPVGVHQAGSYMALPLLLFEKASTKSTKACGDAGLCIDSRSNHCERVKL
jgi:hypothetical protein